MTSNMSHIHASHIAMFLVFLNRQSLHAVLKQGCCENNTSSSMHPFRVKSATVKCHLALISNLLAENLRASRLPIY